jgi:methenyltetrahydromethanopterin cyclohydrolase
MMQLNERAWNLLQELLPQLAALGCEVSHNGEGTLLVDAGCNVAGSIAAGLRMAEIGMAGLGKATMMLNNVGGVPWPVVEVSANQAVIPCLISQAAHWPVSRGEYFPMGSGPACLLNKEIGVAQAFNWNEESNHAVLILETAALPAPDVCMALANACGVPSQALAIMAAATSSLAGSAQIAARSIETALHKLRHIGFNLDLITDAVGRCPLAPPSGDDHISLGKTNDVMIAGSQVWLAVQDCKGEELAQWIQGIPACTSPNYGEPFLKALEKAGGFYNLDPGLFAPAEITLTSLVDGQALHAGKIDLVALMTALGCDV